MSRLNYRTGISSFQLLAVVLVSLSVLPTHLDALFCYRCLAFDCDSGIGAKVATEKDCEDVRTFVAKSLRDYYNVGTILPKCPRVEDVVEWAVMEQQDETTCRVTGNSATCSVGRMQVKTYRGSGQKPSISHATVLGCPQDKLLTAIKNSKVKSQCNIIVMNGTVGASKLFHRMELEHCSQTGNLCYDRDYCIDPEQSVVKEFKPTRFSRFDYVLIVGIIVFIVVIFCAIIGASVCSFPVSKPTNLRRRRQDASLVKVQSSTSATRARLEDSSRESF